MVRKQDNYFVSILKGFTNKLLRGLLKDYKKGAELTISMSPFGDKEPKKPTKKDIEALSGQVFDNIKGVTDIMSKDINNTVRQGILERKDTKEIAKDLDNVFKGENPTGVNYKKRLKMIARTESARVFNAGSFEQAKSLGATKKYISIVNDDRTSDIDKTLVTKYGTPDQAIPVDENYKMVIGKSNIDTPYPPFHPNCRAVNIYLFD